jgi:hypothetical protein
MSGWLHVGGVESGASAMLQWTVRSVPRVNGKSRGDYHEWKTDKLFPHDLKCDLEIMRRNLGIETHLIGDLLDVTAINQGKFRVSFHPHDVHEILDYALETVRLPGLHSGLVFGPG